MFSFKNQERLVEEIKKISKTKTEIGKWKNALDSILMIKESFFKNWQTWNWKRSKTALAVINFRILAVTKESLGWQKAKGRHK